MNNVNFKFWNTIAVVKDEKILLIERRKGDFDGYVAPGGKIEFEESFINSAKRELLEETGLIATKIQLRGTSGFINEAKRDRYIFLDYLCTEFDGNLIEEGPEGTCHWFTIKEVKDLPMLPDIKIRLLELLKGNIYDHQMYWAEENHQVGSTDLISEEILDI